MNKDMYFKMMGLKKEAAQPVNQKPVANQVTTAPNANAPAAAGAGQSKAETPNSNARNMRNILEQGTSIVPPRNNLVAGPVTNAEYYKFFQNGYDYAKSKLPQYDQKGSFWTNLLNKLYEFFGSKKRFGVLKQESLRKSASISSNMSRDRYDKMMSLYSRVHSS